MKVSRLFDFHREVAEVWETKELGVVSVVRTACTAIEKRRSSRAL